MVFYEIRIFSQPKIRFACSVRTPIDANRKNIIDHRKNILELDLHENENVHTKTDTDEYDLHMNEIGLYMPDTRYTLTNTEKVLSCSSIAVEIDHWEYIRHNTDEPQKILPHPSEEDVSTLFLPRVSVLSQEDLSLFAAIQKNVINSYLLHTAASHMRCLAGWYDMVSILDRSFREQIFGERKQEWNSGYYYAYKAQKYICAHFRENLTLQEIANHLGISVNYCSSLFKKETGQTVLEYITTLRMQEIRAMLNKTPAMSFRQICDSVGLHDVRHAQRIFKRYHGISMQQSKQIDRGLSLYHTNPWEIDELDHDIFGEESE